MIKELFEENHISGLQLCINTGVTSVDEISEQLINFGDITTSNKTDALTTVYSILNKGNFDFSFWFIFRMILWLNYFEDVNEYSFNLIFYSS